MATRRELATPAAPLFCKDRLDIPPMSMISITQKYENYVCMGLVKENPVNTPFPDEVEIFSVKARDMKNLTSPEYSMETMRFKRDQILKLEIIKTYEETMDLVERVLITQVLHAREEVKNMLEMLEKEKARSCVISAMIEGAGRFGDMGWLCVCYKGVMFCMDIQLLGDDTEFWRMMDKDLFQRENIVKVCFNGNSMIDFLYHQKGIKKIVNYFDTQVAEMFIRAHQNKDDMPRRLTGVNPGNSRFNWEYMPLSECYMRFVPRLILPEELEMLKKYENVGFNKDSPYLKRPIPPKDPHYKVHALSAKYVQDMYDVQMKILGSHITHCMREQMKYMYRGNNAVMMQIRHIPENVWSMMGKGMPYLSDDRSADYDL